MDKQIHELIETMYQNLWEAQQQVRIYEALYASRPEVVEMLNSSAPHYFATQQGIIPDYIVIVLCRVLDPASQGRFNNATLEALLKSVQDEVLRGELADLLGKMRLGAQRLRQARNQRIAHLAEDHRSTFGSKGFSLQEILGTIELVDEFLAKVNMSFAKKFEFKQTDAAAALLACLAKAKHYDQLVLEGRISRQERAAITAPFYKTDPDR